MCVLLLSGETRNYINVRKERSRLWDRSEEEVDLDPEEVILAVTEAKDGLDQKVDSEAEEDSPTEEDSREGSLTKAPLQRDPMYPVRLKIKTKINVIIAIRGDILQPIALREIRLNL